MGIYQSECISGVVKVKKITATLGKTGPQFLSYLNGIGNISNILGFTFRFAPNSGYMQQNDMGNNTKAGYCYIETYNNRISLFFDLNKENLTGSTIYVDVFYYD